MREERRGDAEIAVVADVVHRARRGNRWWRRERTRDGRGHGRGRRRRRRTAVRRQRPGAPSSIAMSPAAAASGRADRQRGQAAPTALLPGGRMGLGGRRLRVSGARAQPRTAAVVRHARGGRAAEVPGCRLRDDRSVFSDRKKSRSLSGARCRGVFTCNFLTGRRNRSGFYLTTPSSSLTTFPFVGLFYDTIIRYCYYYY